MTQINQKWSFLFSDQIPRGERERERKTLSICVFACVRETERVGEKEKERESWDFLAGKNFLKNLKIKF